MSLQNAQIAAGATSGAVTGGSAVALSPDGLTVVNGLHLVVAADTDFRTRRNMTIKQKSPSLNPANGVYSKDKKSITFVAPKILADGSTVFNLVRIEREVHPESTPEEAFELLMVGVQICADSDFTSFWSVGSLS